MIIRFCLGDPEDCPSVPVTWVTLFLPFSEQYDAVEGVLGDALSLSLRAVDHRRRAG
jgi:hypothetical protein